ncbi:DUF559 domain-containing protein [Aeromicrobium sp.]|uniref:DUF559 domain-containing protein n=1 Tax=Aeromicrobium sp. TaxID=1871063 RepID=UPI00199DE9F4|nr:DUF559 domain-containing protein [Aeromicrobium sp.]MBC7632638.1 DUF559 domain-containing protein [Aeromicrobium sp.]
MDDPSATAIRTARALREGATPAELRGPGWHQAEHGLVKRASLEEDPVMSRISLATGLMTDGCFLGGWASLHVQGNSWFDGLSRGKEEPVLVHCPRGAQLRTRPSINPFRGLVHPDEIISLENYDVTTMARAAFDEMRVASGVREAVVALDMATSTTIGLPHTTRERVGQVIGSHLKVRGVVDARRAWELGSSRSASPWETRTRLLAEVDVGTSRLAVNIPIFDLGGRLLGIVDLLDEEAGLVIESDGADHRKDVRHTDDNRREEKLERSGLVVVRVTALDHRDRWGTVGRIAAARRDASRTIKHAWTTEKPDWWWTWPPARQWD